MPGEELHRGDKFIKKRRQRSRWHKIMVVLSSVVVFCTTYALILPAITMEKGCQLPEHTHGESCYETRMVPVLDCQAAVHSHTAGCRDENGELVCGYADFQVHTHGENCWDGEGNLICALPEIETHTHEESCYVLQKHTHEEDCYEKVAEELLCQEPEVPDHHHDDRCSGQVQELTCGQEETAGHTHGPECYTLTPVLSCGMEESEAHTHGDTCWTEEETLTCGQAEAPAHSHNGECYTLVQLVCDKEETEGHAHGDDCWEWSETLICEVPEEEWAAVCGQPEIILHTHDAWVNPEYPGCYDETGTLLVCGKVEVREHVHDDSCFREEERQVLTCTLEEHAHGETCQAQEESSYYCGLDVHTHEETCYDEAGNPICGLEEHTHTDECQIPPETEPVYVCGKEAHTHEETCFDEEGNPICGLEEHTHTDDCVAQQEPQIGDCICGKEEHTHGEACFDGEGTLICPLEEHTHWEQCLLRELTEEEQARVDALIQAIDDLPGNEEITETLAQLEAAEDQEGYDSYLAELASQALSIYARYEDMEPSLRHAVTNAQKLLDMAWLWSADTLDVKTKITVYQVNQYTEAKTTLVYGGSVREKLGADMDFTYWDAVFVMKSNGKFYVEKYVTADESKLDYQAPEDGFLLLLINTMVETENRSAVEVDFDYTATTGNAAEGHGTVSFVTKADKNSVLDTVPGADTRNLIEVNLYDYGTNINNLYNGNTKYPGFQQDNGTTWAGTTLGKYSFNFGNNITADLAAGHTKVTNQGGAINATADGANSPISGAISPKLGTDGYPALADGTSLKYLFSNSSYATKQNSKSINGLFQYNSTTGAYTFNSRTNHAQFNRGSDTFTLYKQIITSNFMMYPFGNFLPFNDIVHQSAQASTIDGPYLQSIANSAKQKYNNGSGDAYNTLATSLGKFVDVMNSKYPKGWDAADCATEYFKAAELDKTFTTEDLANIYSIDYDEPTDFYFGMEMKMNFMQPHNGLTGLDGQQPMVFDFSGDDDVWVYIDGILFLDLSGIHRHVGGKIDFVKGEVTYSGLNVGTGDVGVAYKTVKFSELVDSDKLNENGTFKDYSTHTFNFYYMERGAGSGVCRMNFNFPLLQKNSISVSKALSVDEGDASLLLGNPDFRFQALKEDGETLFIAPGTQYKILDAKGKEIGTGTTDANGIFTLKAGQTAMFSGIEEDEGKYFIRELLDASVFEQYGEIAVDGTSQTENYDVTVGTDSFKGVNSPVKDMADGSTVFHFNNKVSFQKTGSLSITKTLTQFGGTKDPGEFKFKVTLDGSLLPVGTAYAVGEETRTVAEAGIIPLKKDETAVISGILAGTPYTVEEITTDGYWITYICGDKSQMTPVSGTIGVASQVKITVNNSEKGTNLDIPVEKTLLSPDGEAHTFSFRFIQVTDETGQTETGEEQTVDIAITAQPASETFHVEYPSRMLESTPGPFYYKVTEVVSKAELGTIYDQSVYVLEVTVTQSEDSVSAAITKVWKNGEELSANSPIAFVNKLDSYELPQTGGVGTAPYTLGGTALALGAALLLYNHRKRRRGEDSST